MSTIESSVGNSVLETITSNYVANESEGDTSVLGKEAFLTLLVAQMENQDPLNPLESTEYASQLAQYSSLEQQLNTNTYLEEISAKLDENTEYQPIDYIGKEILTETGALEVINNNTQSVAYSIGASGNVEMVVYDDSGEEVRRIRLGAKVEGTHEVSWDGTDDNGDTVLDGTYTYSISAADENGNSIEVDTSETGVVEGVSFVEGTAYLKVDGRLVDPEDVVEVRDQQTEA